MRQRLKLFATTVLTSAASASRASPVAKAPRSQHARDKDASRCADDGLALHSFRTLLKDLGTLAYNITHTIHTDSVQSLLAIRHQPGLYPVAAPPANKKFKRDRDLRFKVVKVRPSPNS
jgi:hypothetical protein